MAKVQAMTRRIRDIHPGCEVHGVEDFLSAENVAQLLAAELDGVVDAIDESRAKAALVVYCQQRRLPLICVGGAGGRLDPARVRVADLAQTTQDPLLARLRANLRRWHGFPRDPGRRFGIPCVYSTEPLRRPLVDGGACDERPGDGRLHGLNCAGYGSSVCVSATFGLMAAALMIEQLLAAARGTTQ
jgi:tRNA A37 threonylcarbamoyladenosine dehydratase